MAAKTDKGKGARKPAKKAKLKITDLSARKKSGAVRGGAGKKQIDFC